jgi:group I intron endonuclease
MKSGIYRITSPSGRVYIGQSINIPNRIKDYKSKQKILSQTKLRNSFIKHGFENHLFDVLEYCDVEALSEREVFYINKYESFSNKDIGLNLTVGGEGSRGFKHSEASKKIISEKALVRKRNCSGVKNGFYGKKHTIEFTAKIKERATGKNNPRYGVKLSEETKQKIREKLTGRKLSSERTALNKTYNLGKGFLILNTENGIFYGNVREASESSVYKESTLRGKINKRSFNNTPFIYA